ncbi:hypothetical protein TrCOL_g6859 [Triparma columacea]|uniref:Formamidopyrimidine-DNA glycosylase H2TH DNA-binding domain-containing protein n=1 Tax=Triparma columacea TaxID=722753 RepID=A0A9W7GKK1_9STRA|nr:hypothetical protein TrCOL_g6859 [Triparma columacea]
MGEGPSVKAWVEKNRKKIGSEVTKEVYDGDLDWPLGKPPDLKGGKLMKMECLGKLILTTFEKEIRSSPFAARTTTTTTTLLLCRGSGGGRDNGVLMKLNFPGNLSITIFKAGESNRGAFVTTISVADAQTLRSSRQHLDVTGDDAVFNADAVLDVLGKADQKQYLATVLLDQTIFPGVGNVMKIECLFHFSLHPEALLKDVDGEKRREIVLWLRDFAMRWYKLKVATTDEERADILLGAQLYWINARGMGHENDAPEGYQGRRKVVCPRSFCGEKTSTMQGFSPTPALAFQNKLDTKYDDRPRQRGSPPKDLGFKSRETSYGVSYDGLKPCKPSPNCFCSSPPPPDAEDDPLAPIPIPRWVGPSSATMDDVVKVINTYEVGHDSIDGGGFKIISQSPTYLYVQFESYKNGYVDDFEVAMLPGSPPTFDVRSSSRLGYLDYGVNAKRINYIANRLNSEYNWSAPGVNLSKFQNYAILNSLS